MTASKETTTSSAILLLMATAFYSLGAVIDDPVFSVAATSLASIAVVAALINRRLVTINPVVAGGALAILVLLLANTQRMSRFSVEPGTYKYHFLLGLITSIAALLSARWDFHRAVAVLAVLTVLVGAATILIPNWEPELSSDVYRAHVAAGWAMANAENPYSDAVLFESGDPSKPDDTLVKGYPYPPPPLLTYGVVAAFTDARVVSLVAWVAVVVGLAALAVGKNKPRGVALAALVLVATTPIWRMGLFMAWTEPVSLALFALSAWGMVKGRRWGWLFLGVALASKQYLVFLLPVVLLYKDAEGRRSGWSSLGAAGVVTLAPALLGPAEYLRAIVGNTLAIGFRPDTQSINGAIATLGGNLMLPVALTIPLVAVLFLAYRNRVGNELLPAAGVLTLATVFLVTSAFPNYWMLLVGMVAFAAISASTCDQNCRSKLSDRFGRDMDIPA